MVCSNGTLLGALSNATAAQPPPPTVLERLTAADLRLFFAVLMPLCAGGAALLALSACAQWRSFPQLLAAGWAPARAHLLRRGGALLGCAGVLLAVLGGVAASAAAPSASFLGVGVCLMVPGLALLGYAAWRTWRLGAAVDQDPLAAPAGYAGLALVWAWEAGLAGTGTLDGSGAWLYNFHAVGWVGLNVSFTFGVLVCTRLLAPRGTLEPRALAALALQWHRVRAACSSSGSSSALAAAAAASAADAPLVHYFLAKGRLPKKLQHTLDAPEGYSLPRQRQRGKALQQQQQHASLRLLQAAPPATPASAAAAAADPPEPLTLLPLYVALYFASLAAYSYLHYAFAPPAERFVGAVLAAGAALLDASLLACLAVGVLEAPAQPLLASFTARVLLTAFPAHLWLLGLSSLFAVLAHYLGRAVLRRALLEGSGAWGAAGVGVGWAGALLLLVGASFACLFGMLMRSGGALPLPDVAFPGMPHPLPQTACAYSVLVAVALALALELCLRLWAWQDPAPLAGAAGASGALRARPAREWTRAGLALVAATVALCAGAGVGFALGTGVWFAVPGAACPPAFGLSALAWYGRWVNDGGVWWLPGRSARARARNAGNAGALAVAAAALAAFGLCWQYVEPPLPELALQPCDAAAAAAAAISSAAAAAPPPDAFTLRVLPYLGYAASAAVALLCATALPLLSYRLTLRVTPGALACAALACALYCGLVGALAGGAGAWGAGSGSLLALGTAAAAYPGLVCVAGAALLWGEGGGEGGGRQQGQLPRAALGAGVGGAAWVAAALAYAVRASAATASTGSGGSAVASAAGVVAPSAALAAWLAACALAGALAWRARAPPHAPLPRALLLGGAAAGAACVAAALALALWEGLVQRSPTRALLAGSAVYAVAVACAVGGGLLQLARAGAFVSLLRAPRAQEALRGRLEGALAWGRMELAAVAVRGVVVVENNRSGAALHAPQQQQQQQHSAHEPMPAAHRLALAGYLACLCDKAAPALLAEGSAGAGAAGGGASGAWAGAAPAAGGRRLLLPGTLLPAYYYEPALGRPARERYGLPLVLGGALGVLLWALAAVAALAPVLVGLLVSLTSRTLLALLLLDLLHRAAAETQSALELLGHGASGAGGGSDSSSDGSGSGAVAEAATAAAAAACAAGADASPAAARAATLDALLSLLLDELGCPAEGRGAGGCGSVQPYPYFSVFPSFAHAARLRHLQARLRSEAGAAAVAEVGGALGRRRGGSGGAATHASNPLALAEEGAGAEAAKQGARGGEEGGEDAETPLVDRLADPAQRAAYAALGGLPSGTPLRALAAQCAELEGAHEAALGAEERLALGLLCRVLKAAEAVEGREAQEWRCLLAWAAGAAQAAALRALGMAELGHFARVLECAGGSGSGGPSPSAPLLPPLTIPSGSAGEPARAPPPGALRSKAALLHFLEEQRGPAALAGAAAALAAAGAMHAAWRAAVRAAAEGERAREREAGEAREAREREAARAALAARLEEARGAGAAEAARAAREREAAREEAERAAAAAEEAARAARAVAGEAEAARALAGARERERAAAAALVVRQASERLAAEAAQESAHAREALEARQRAEREAAAAAGEAARAAAAREGEAARAAAEAEAARERGARDAARSAARARDEAAAAAAARAREAAALAGVLAADAGECERAQRGDDSASRARMAALLAGKGQGWRDPHLPHAPASLAPTQRAVVWVDFSRLRAGGSEGSDGAQLQQQQQQASWSLGLEDADPSDPKQGELGDCWLIAALSILASRRECLARVLQVLPDGGGGSAPGAIGVRLWGARGWQEYALDVFVPSAEGSRCAPLYCRPARAGALWPVALEKAFARHFGGGYGALRGGNITAALCALIPGSVGSEERLAEYAGREDVLWGDLLAWTAAGHILGASSVHGSDAEDERARRAFQNIVKGHAFGILSVREVRDGGVAHRLLQLRNPWGATEWSGAYGDQWEGWWDARGQPSSLNRRVFSPPRPHPDAAGQGDAWDDGVFFMPFADFLTHFAAVQVCRVFPLAPAAPLTAAPRSPTWHLATAAGVWSCEAGSVGGEAWTPMRDCVPRYLLRAPAGSDLFIVLRFVLPLAAPPSPRHGKATTATVRLRCEEMVEGKLASLGDSYKWCEAQTYLELDAGRHAGGSGGGGARALLLGVGCKGEVNAWAPSAGGGELHSFATPLADLGGVMHYTLSVYSSQPYGVAAPLTAGADAQGKCLLAGV